MGSSDLTSCSLTAPVHEMNANGCFRGHPVSPVRGRPVRPRAAVRAAESPGGVPLGGRGGRGGDGPGRAEAVDTRARLRPLDGR
jgi:hypothetical protein